MPLPLHELGQSEILDHLVFHRLVSTQGLVARSGEEEVLAIGDRVPPPAALGGSLEVRKAQQHGQEDLRLDEALPEGLHELTAKDREEVCLFFSQSRDRSSKECWPVCRVRICEEQQVAGRDGGTLMTRPGLSDPVIG